MRACIELKRNLIQSGILGCHKELWHCRRVKRFWNFANRKNGKFIWICVHFSIIPGTGRTDALLIVRIYSIFAIAQLGTIEVMHIGDI